MGTIEHAIAERTKQSIRGCVFRRQDVVGVDLTSADLRDARFEEVEFTSCNFAGADLRGAQFIVCTMRSIVLRDVVLGENHFYGTTILDAIGLAEDDRWTIERCGGLFPSRDATRSLVSVPKD